MEKRTGEEWSAFVVKQQARIEERIGRYSNPETIKEQIKELKNLTPYQNYKISTMVPILQRVIRLMISGGYGICCVCKCEIAIERLKLVPAALACVKCDEERTKRG